MNLILADDQFRDQLLPFVFTRPVAEIRCGILTIRNKWEHVLNVPYNSSSSLTLNYLSDKYPLSLSDNCLVINGALMPDEFTIKVIKELKIGQQLTYRGRFLAGVMNSTLLVGKNFIQPINELDSIEYDHSPLLIENIWDIFSINELAVKSDFLLLTTNRKSEIISPSNHVFNVEQIFIEQGAKVECSYLNASNGPIYIGKNAEVMEGCMIRGPFVLGDNSVLKMGAKIYGATTIGPGSKVGGEVSNSVIFGNSNKGHEGFLGNSVIGEWCNLGADTNNSNLKNNYSEVKVWNFASSNYVGTGLQFCGLFMGDHSKCGINTMFNTGTVVGVFANIFGAGFPEKFIPSFTWGGTGETEIFLIDKAIDIASKVMARRNIEMSSADKDIISHLFMMQLKPPADF